MTLTFKTVYHRIIVRQFPYGPTTTLSSMDAPVDSVPDHFANVLFLIGAPREHSSLDTNIVVTFYVDSEPMKRNLNENEVQVLYDAGGPLKETFEQWAMSLVEFMRLMLFRLGMVSVDFADLLTIIHFSSSKRFRFEKIPYDDHATVPYDKHTGAGYRTLYSCVAGPVDLSLAHYSDLQSTLELHNAGCIMIKTAMTIAAYDPPMMMLLGEPINA